MSSTPSGEGWWQASDGKWYPPNKVSSAHLPPPPASARAADPTLILKIGVLVGGALVAISSLLPFVTAGTGFVSINRTAFQLGQGLSLTVDGPLILVFGLLLVAIGITRLSKTGMPGFVQKSPTVLGVVTCLEVISLGTSINSLVNSMKASGVAIASFGMGFWLCVVGAVVATLSAIALRIKEKA